MFFFIVEDMREQIAADIIAHAFRIFDRIAQQRNSVFFQSHIRFQDLFDGLADAQFVHRLKIGQAVEEQHTLCQLVRMLHLFDGFLTLILGQFGHAPIIKHAVMQPVLIDRCQLIRESFVKEFNDFGIALHRECS